MATDEVAIEYDNVSVFPGGSLVVSVLGQYGARIHLLPHDLDLVKLCTRAAERGACATDIKLLNGAVVAQMTPGPLDGDIRFSVTMEFYVRCQDIVDACDELLAEAGLNPKIEV